MPTYILRHCFTTIKLLDYLISLLSTHLDAYIHFHLCVCLSNSIAVGRLIIVYRRVQGSPHALRYTLCDDNSSQELHRHQGAKYPQHPRWEKKELCCSFSASLRTQLPEETLTPDRNQQIAFLCSPVINRMTRSLKRMHSSY